MTGTVTAATTTHQVTFKDMDTPFSQRYNKYLDPTFFQHRIHWFSIFNSFMMVLFLVRSPTTVCATLFYSVFYCLFCFLCFVQSATRSRW